jgi:hypothetical protein
MRFRLPEVSVLRELNHADIDRILDSRIQSRRESAERWATQGRLRGIGPAIPIIQSNRWHNITDEMRENLHTIADFLIATRVDYKLVISIDMAWVYTNSVVMLDELRHYPVYAKKFTEAVVDKPKRTIVLKSPNHTHRSYFRAGKLSASEKDSVVTFINNHLDEIRPSPSLLMWMEEPYFRTYEYFFIDHNGPYWLTMIGLVKPGLIKKTYDIICDK